MVRLYTIKTKMFVRIYRNVRFKS